MKIFPQSIRKKLILVIVLTGVLAGTLVGGTLIARHLAILTNVAENHLRTQADLIAIHSAATLAFNDRASAQETLEALRALPEITVANIYDAQGRLFATFRRPQLEDRELPAVDPFTPGQRHTGDWLVLSGKPIMAAGDSQERLGTLSMIYDIGPMRDLARSSVLISLLLGAGATMVGLLAGVLVKRVIMRPLRELDRRAREVSETKNYTVRAMKYGEDEFGQLTDVFNEMLDQVERAEREREHLLESERIARGEAEHASQMKDEFVATLSHELRSPLSAIAGWVHVLRRLLPSSEEALAAHRSEGKVGQTKSPALSPQEKDEQIAKGLEVIERNARVQTQLIEDLLDMARIVSGKIRLDVQEVDLPGVIEQALATAEPAARAKEIRLQKTIDPRVAPMHGDPGRLLQIVWNLLSNAIKFTPRHGRVQVVLQRINSHVELIVSDTGGGIAPEFLPHLFERFRQADASTTRRYGGLGLGLAIVKNLVELHGGAIIASSAGLGTGSTFTVKLPLAILHPRPQEERVHPRALATGTSAVSASGEISLRDVRVLVVEDEPDARDLIRHLLEGAEARVYCAGSGEEALSVIEEFRPEVLVSDIGMPGKDGYQFIREVRARSAERGGMTPAIALTAFARSEDRTRALVAGFQMHIAKPVNPDELVVSVASLAGLVR